MTSGAGRPLRVAAAVIRRADGRVLLGRRDPARHQGGLWEFPGGKLESRERQIDALARELREELGISIDHGVPLIRIVHEYADRTVDLEVLEVDAWDGEPAGCEGQPIRWVPPEALAGVAFPDANVPVSTAVSLPRMGLVTPPLGDDAPEDYLARLARCLEAGVTLVRLSPLTDDGAVARDLHRNAVRLCKRHGARVLVDGVPGEALLAEADGVHLSAPRLLQLSVRPLPPGHLVSAGCHGAADLDHAARLGVDFCYLSPVHAPDERPAADALGWHGLRRLARRAVLPVYALGGMHAGDARLALRAGCQGLAMRAGLWDAQDPAAVLDAAAGAAAGAAYAVSA